PTGHGKTEMADGFIMVAVIIVPPTTIAEGACATGARPLPVGNARPPAFTKATSGFSVLHCTVEVKSCVLPSLNEPIALHCCGPPRATIPSVGVMRRDCSVDGFTVALTLPLTPPAVAVTVTAPSSNPPVATPLWPTPVVIPGIPGSLLMVATSGLAEVHQTASVKS